jgi:erythritol transport system substrate-binding protein
MNVMETMLQSHPDIDGVFAINDSTALGALAALRQAKGEDVVIANYRTYGEHDHRSYRR